MANGADGSITIDTALDNSGFKRGTQQMETAVNSLLQSCDRAGKSIASAVQSVNPALRDIARQAQATGAQMADSLSQGDFGKAMAAIEKQAGAVSNQLARLGSAESAGIKTEAQMGRFQQATEAARRSLAEMVIQLNRYANTPVNSAEFERLTNEIGDLEIKLQNLYKARDSMQKMGIGAEDSSMKMLQAQIIETERLYDNLLQQKNELAASGGAVQLGGDTAQYQQMAGQIGEAATQLEHFQNVQQQIPGSTDHAAGALSRFGAVLGGLGRLASMATMGAARIGFAALQRGANAAANGIRGLVGHLKNFHKQGGKSALTANGLVKSLLSVKRMLLTRIKRTFISALFNSMKAGMNSLARYSSAFNAAMSSMKNSMTGLSGNMAVMASNLINAIAPAISTIIDWINKAVTALNALFAMLSGKGTFTVAKKGTDNYAKSLGGASKAAKDLKNQVYGFDELNKATDNSNSGGGGGSGGSVDFEEKSVADYLPKALQELGQAIKDAFTAGEFEKVGAIVAGALNNVIYSVDNWINTKFRPATVLWTSNITRIINGFVDKLDFTALGGTLASGFNTITNIVQNFFGTLDWHRLAEQFANGLNGFVSRVEWDRLGDTIGSGFMSLHTALWETLGRFNWTGLGSGLATGINHMFAAVNWTEAATQVSDALKGALEGLRTAIAETDWQAIAQDISDFITGIDWAGVGSALNDAINAIFDALLEFTTSLDWKGIGAAIGSALNELDIDKWISDAGTLLLNFIKGCYNSAAGFIEEIDWTEIGGKLWSGIEGFVSEFDWEGLVSSMFEALGAAVGALVGLVAGFAEKLWGKVKEGWEATKQYFSEYFDAYGGNVIEGLYAGIVNALKAVGTWVHDNVIKPLISGMEKALGLESGTISNIASNLWTKLKEGLSSAWNTVSSAVTQIFTDALEAIKGAWASVKDWGTDIWEGIKNGLSSAWTNLKESILSPFKQMWQAVLDFFGISSPSTEAEAAAKFILEGLVAGFEAAVDAVVSTVKSIFGKIWDAIKSIFGFGSSESDESKEAKQAGKDIMTGMESGIKGDEETVKKAIAEAAKHVLQKLRSELGIPESGGSSSKTKTIGEGVVSGIKDGIEAKGTEGTFSGAMNKVWTATRNAIDTAFGTKGEGSSAKNAKYAGQGVALGINDGITDKAKRSTFNTAAGLVISAVKDAINSAFGGGEGSSATKTAYAGNGAVMGIVDGINAKAVSSTFSKAANNTYKGVSDAFNSALGISGGGWLSGASAASKFVSVGQAICQGVANGINNSAYIMANAASTAAAQALAAAKARLGIHSPSKAFAEVGDYMMQGMAVGLKDGQGSVLKTVSGIARNLINGVSDDAKIGIAADGMLSGLDNLADRLDRIGSIFEGIAAAIFSMGGLPMPALASGAYMPALTRSANTDSYGGAAMAAKLDQFEADVNEELSGFRDYLRQIAENTLVTSRKDFSIDGESLERGIASLRRSRIRSYGGDEF